MPHSVYQIHRDAELLRFKSPTAAFASLSPLLAAELILAPQGNNIQPSSGGYIWLDHRRSPNV